MKSYVTIIHPYQARPRHPRGWVMAIDDGGGYRHVELRSLDLEGAIEEAHELVDDLGLTVLVPSRGDHIPTAKEEP